MIRSQRSKDLESAEWVLRKMEYYVAANFHPDGAVILRHARHHLMEQIYNVSFERISGYSLDTFVKRREGGC